MVMKLIQRGSEIAQAVYQLGCGHNWGSIPA
jgi:hypothetical protein